MKINTRVELAVLLIGAVVVGGWVGLRGAQRTPGAERTLTTRREAGPTPRIMTAPPAEAPDKTRMAAAAIKAAQPTDPDMAKAENLLSEGKKFEARAMLTRLILQAPEGPQREELRRMLDSINRQLFFSRAPSPDCVFHKVKGGDTLSGIARKHHKDVYFSQLIMRLNGIRDAKRIQPGQRLKIPEGKFSALIQKNSHRLIILLNGHYIKEYRVGLGTSVTPTPESRFVVGTKKVNPDWYAPDGVYKYGDPRNILGTRWIGFVETEQYQGYGIHGTSDPDSIGKNVSNGCVRLLNKDVEEIFAMLMAGDTVEIK